MFDRRTDGRTDRQTAFSSLDRVCIPCSAVKTAIDDRHFRLQIAILANFKGISCENTDLIAKRLHRDTDTNLLIHNSCLDRLSDQFPRRGYILKRANFANLTFSFSCCQNLSTSGPCDILYQMTRTESHLLHAGCRKLSSGKLVDGEVCGYLDVSEMRVIVFR